jgi:peptidoglycan/xylan/chitin deacetylase (PgdA/CDA1 family)
VTGVILMYHRVAKPADDAYGLAVSPDHFGAQVAHLNDLDCVVPLTDILEPSKALKVAITFDDGYADNASTAAPLLASAGLPATYFITTGRLGGRHFWWDRLAAGLLSNHPKPSGIDVTVGGRALWLALHDPGACLTSLRFLHRRLRPLPPDELLATVDDLLERLGAPEPPDDQVSMTAEELREISQLPVVAIGAHTRTHLQLSGQNEDLQQDEVMGSLADLREILNQPITSFAYPFGSRSAVGDLAPRLIRESGCALACSTEEGSVHRGSDRYRLPRLNVRDWDAAEFAGRIDELAHDR